ncbi:hypothetical protein PFDG_02377 [Plasmodium falciparum Dd2]|uniref:Uncharacterized protein n=1 Tax=Plasmodium falciparum (isolate Dd2) TaxID=57267 RepID=A0A0L7M6G6_PLAF4|nr:hypothetical protein PFDG_02377 [Plasmodium falciparum Dd2]
MGNTHDNIMMSGREIEIARNRYFSSLRSPIYILCVHMYSLIFLCNTYEYIYTLTEQSVFLYIYLL